MAIIKEHVYGGPSIGVYLSLSNKYFLYPSKVNPNLIQSIQAAQPDLILIETFIGGSSVVGSLTVMNSHGILVPSTILDEELAKLEGAMDKKYKIAEIEAEDNAFGNLVLCNDKGAIISPKLANAKQMIAKTLNVPVKIYEFAKSDLPGSCGLVNNHGVVVHPMISETEAEVVATTLGVEIDVSTINCGNPYLGGGAIVSDFLAIFGRETTGPEIQRMTEILHLE
jgi:translation initiation factor 6